MSLNVDDPAPGTDPVVIAPSTSADAPTRHRRRGEDLESALLLATWEEFTEVGFYDLTFEAVARRAGTSRAVLYRRWPGKVELVAAAARYALAKQRGPEPEPTGSLREDLVARLRWANRTDVRSMIAATTHVGAYLAAEGVTFAEVRTMMMPTSSSATFSPIDAAIARGEVDPAHVTPRLASLAFDLFRHEVLLNAQPLTERAISEIVDEIVVPLLTRKE
jgi:AcrR family transcriptional regulator